MGNVYGIASPLALPTKGFAGSDVACPSGTETTVITTGVLVAPAPGDYYPMLWCTVAVLLGATPPTSLTVAFKLASGSDVTSDLFAAAVLVGNATVVGGFVFIGANSPTAWVGAGTVINLTVLAAAQAVTFKASGSSITVALFRGPDA